MEAMTLREVCNAVGVTRRAVQCYEKEELVSPTGKNKYGYLLYDAEAVKRIQEIRMYQEFGFALKDIRLLLEYSQKEYVEMMERKLAEMRKQLLRLEANIVKVEELIAEKQK